MSKLSFALGILVLPLALLSIQAQPAETKPGTATVSGRVTLKGEAARNVTVYLQSQRSPAPSNPAAVLRARTGDDGQFRITGVAAGAYSLIALAPGFTSPGDEDFGARGKTISVSEGERVENVEIEIKRGGVITGRVTDSQGRPLVEESLRLGKLDKSGKPQPDYYLYNLNYEMFVTDDRGVYRIYGLLEGRYLVSVGVGYAAGAITVTGSRIFYPRTFHPDAANESEAKVIEVTEGSESANVDITVPEAARSRTVSGRVVSAETEQPVAGVEIAYGTMSRDGRGISAWGWKNERSKANGEFHLMGLLPGQYGIFARTESDSDFYSEPVMCDLSNGDLSGVEIKLRQGGSISGGVVIEGTNDPKTLAKLPQLSIYVNVRPNQSSAPGQLTAPRRENPKINADGSFRVRGLQQGKVDIGFSPMPNQRGFSLARIEHNGAPLPVREGIEVGPGEHVTGVRVVLAYGSLTLRGEVKIVGGALPAGQRLFSSVRKTDQSSQFQSSLGAEVDARGQFLIENLAPGEYEVRVFPIANPGGDRIDPQITRAFSSVKERVLVSGDNQPPVTIVVDLSRKEGNQ